jgi:uracil-DNA glycosylase
MNELDKLHTELINCNKCVLCGYLKKANPIFSGSINSKVMLIGQAPGVKNEIDRFPFNGGTGGKRLFQWLEKAGWTESEFREKQYIASVTRCFPGKAKNGTDRVPSNEEQELCKSWLKKELELLDIKIIIPMGKLAIGLFFDKKKPLSEIIGQTFLIDNRIIVPIPHPSGASTWHNMPENKVLLEKTLSLLRELKIKHKI